MILRGRRISQPRLAAAPGGSADIIHLEALVREKQDRREFLEHGLIACSVFCGMLALRRIVPGKEKGPGEPGQKSKPIDLKTLSYCGIPQAYCERQCELFKATRDDDAKLKKAVFDQWGMEKKFGVEFAPDKIFCYGCKPGDRPLKVGMAECPVRACPMANGLESCVQCLSLAACDKAFWTEWPIAYANAKTLQARYKAQPGAVLKEAAKN